MVKARECLVSLIALAHQNLVACAMTTKFRGQKSRTRKKNKFLGTEVPRNFSDQCSLDFAYFLCLFSGRRAKSSQKLCSWELFFLILGGFSPSENCSTIKFALSKFYCRGVSHEKQHFWTFLDDFPLCPQDPPPQKRKFYFYCRLAVSENRTIAIASDFRVDGAKSPEILQKEGGLGSEIAAQNRESLPTFHHTLKSQYSIAFSCLGNRCDFWGPRWASQSQIPKIAAISAR